LVAEISGRMMSAALTLHMRMPMSVPRLTDTPNPIGGVRADGPVAALGRPGLVVTNLADFLCIDDVGSQEGVGWPAARGRQEPGDVYAGQAGGRCRS
jgi:hypothetical protein